MFCSQCGVEVADAAAFCRKCGASLRDDVAPPAPQPVEQQPPAQQVYQQPTPQQQVVAQQRPAATQAMRHTLGTTKPVQPAIGVAVMIGSALAVIGTMLPWIDFAGATANGFDIGYLTDSSGGGNDGIVVLLLGLAAGALAVHYFMKPNPLLSLGSLILGAAAAGVAGYNLVRLISDIRDGCGGCNVMDYLGFGLYVSIAGGAIAAGAAFIGLRREGAS
jgi:hypothetical protein